MGFHLLFFVALVPDIPCCILIYEGKKLGCLYQPIFILEECQVPSNIVFTSDGAVSATEPMTSQFSGKRADQCSTDIILLFITIELLIKRSH